MSGFAVFGLSFIAAMTIFFLLGILGNIRVELKRCADALEGIRVDGRQQHAEREASRKVLGLH